MSKLDRYTKAMLAGDTDICAAIEDEHGVYGLPPEVVSMVLAGADAVALQDALASCLVDLLDKMEPPPEANCACHLCPPCNDCVDYGGLREAIETSKHYIAKVKHGACAK